MSSSLQHDGEIKAFLSLRLCWLLCSQWGLACHAGPRKQPPPDTIPLPSVTHHVPVLSTGESWAPSSGKRLLEGEHPGTRAQLFILVNAYGRNVSHRGFPEMFSVSAPWHMGCRGFMAVASAAENPRFCSFDLSPGPAAAVPACSMHSCAGRSPALHQGHPAPQLFSP